MIVTIENHCSADQQSRQAEILEDILGSKLYRFHKTGDDLYKGPENWVSPEDLKGLVVIRDKPKRGKKSKNKKRTFSLKSGRKLKQGARLEKETNEAAVLVDDLFGDDEDEEASPSAPSTLVVAQPTTQPRPTPSPFKHEASDLFGDEVEEEGVGAMAQEAIKQANLAKLNLANKLGTGNAGKLGLDITKLEERIKVEDSHHDLLQIVYIKNVKLKLKLEEITKKEERRRRSLTESMPKAPVDGSSTDYTPTTNYDTELVYTYPPFASSSSMVESKMLKLTRPGPRAASTAAYARTHLLRAYPNAKRVDSSNYDPCPAWNGGFSVVALNYQTNSKPVWISQGKFSINGACGYVLKPQAMLEAKPAGGDPTKDFKTNPYWDLLPRTPSGGGEGTRNKGVLRVTICSGHFLPKPNGRDVSKSEVIDAYVEMSMHGLEQDCVSSIRTPVKSNNGFNPSWDFVHEFNIANLDLAMLLFLVKDRDVLNSDDLVAQVALPVSSLRTGYRVLPLRSLAGELEKQAYLFCKFEWVQTV